MNRTAPSNRYVALPVATHSNPTNSAKNRNDDPRSFSASNTSNDTPQAAKRGAKYLGSSTSQRPNLRVPVANRSARSARTEAKKIPNASLANSSGWKLKGPTWTHNWAPFTSSPI